MGLKAGFGEFSLPREVREHLAVHYPSLPRSFINGLRAISKTAFTGPENEQIERLERSLRILKTAQYYAPEFYAHTKSSLPERVLTVLAGEAELEYSENLDSILSDDARELLQEYREISNNSAHLNVASCSVDARFTSLIRLYTSADDYLDMLHTGEVELGGEEMLASLRQHNHLRDNILDTGSSVLETDIFNILRRIDMVHQFGHTDALWNIEITRHPDFDEMDEGDLLTASGIQISDTLELALGLALEYRAREHGLDRTQAFTMLADEELSVMRELSTHIQDISPVVLSYMLLKANLGDEELMEAVVETLGKEGSDVAYLHSALGDDTMFAILPQDEKNMMSAYDDALNIVRLKWYSHYLSLIDSADPDFESAQDQILDIIAEVEEVLEDSPPLNESLLEAMQSAYQSGDNAITLLRYLDGEKDNVPSIDNIDQKMSRQDLRNFIAQAHPANTLE